MPDQPGHAHRKLHLRQKVLRVFTRIARAQNVIRAPGVRSLFARAKHGDEHEALPGRVCDEFRSSCALRMILSSRPPGLHGRLGGQVSEVRYRSSAVSRMIRANYTRLILQICLPYVVGTRSGATLSCNDRHHGQVDLTGGRRFKPTHLLCGALVQVLNRVRQHTDSIVGANDFASVAISGSDKSRRGMKVLAPRPAAGNSGVVAAAGCPVEGDHPAGSRHRRVITSTAARCNRYRFFTVNESKSAGSAGLSQG
jgi:hypothetical protein